MSNLQVKDVPSDLHERLRALAEREGCSMRSIVLDAVERELAHREFLAALAEREPVDLGRGAHELLDEARQERAEVLDERLGA